NNDVRTMEENVLMKNPFLEKIFRESAFLYPEPLIISQVSFARKKQVEDHVLMTGDAAGMITPLCGNGMSMALHSSKLAFAEIFQFLQGTINRFEMEMQYAQQWERYFGRRIFAGRTIQRFFGNETMTHVLLSSLKPFPGMISWLIRQTHGEPF
ncbi:MAG: pyridine nucleotide-disulfide oxidoreductase, partial [Flavitalea sp.]